MGKRQPITYRYKREPNPLQSIVVVHGKSEYVFCENIKRTLKLKQEIIANDKGKSSIQITGLNHYLGSKFFQSANLLKSKYEDLQIEKGVIKNCKIFTIMDTDDCTLEQKNAYINGEFKSKYWFKDSIVPIYNNPDLEVTMKGVGIEISHKKDYISVFEPNRWSAEALIDLYNRLRVYGGSNLEEYVGYCLRCKGKI